MTTSVFLIVAGLVIELISFYSTHYTEYGKNHLTISEKWGIWSWMKHGGFIVLSIGIIAYVKIFKLSFNQYDEEKKVLNPIPLVPSP
jgi:putative effector of murein hydrolase